MRILRQVLNKDIDQAKALEALVQCLAQLTTDKLPQLVNGRRFIRDEEPKGSAESLVYRLLVHLNQVT